MKKLIYILLAIFVIIFISIIYLNSVVLPTKIKSLIILGLEEATHKKVSLEKLEFNIFKGLVLKNLMLFDDSKTIINIKETDCAFLILPLFKKNIIIPTLRLNSAVIFLARRADNTYNLLDLFPRASSKDVKKKFASLESPGINPLRLFVSYGINDGADDAKSRSFVTGFNFFVYKVSLKNSRIDFQDNTLSPIFTKTIDNLDALVSLSLPNSVKFKIKAEIPASNPMNIQASGEFRIQQRELIVQINIKDFFPAEFFGYYKHLGFTIAQGKIDGTLNLNLRNGILNVDLMTMNQGIVIAYNKINANLDSQIKAHLHYGFIDKEFDYSGNAAVTNAELLGLEFMDKITGINGNVQFNKVGIQTEALQANILGLNSIAKFELTDFKNPLLNINIKASLGLDYLQKLLHDKFNFIFPADIQGKAELSLNIENRFPLMSPPKIEGSLDILEAILKLHKVNYAFNDIKGRLEFTRRQIKWSELKFSYQDIAYKTNGTLVDFQNPTVQLQLTSNDLSVDSNFKLKDNSLMISKLSGEYINSKFLIQANIDTTDFANLDTVADGTLSIDVKDVKRHLQKFAQFWETVEPVGVIDVEFKTKGSLRDIKSCAIWAKFTSPSVSIYGLSLEDFLLIYNQENGLAEFLSMSSALYDGKVESIAKMNLNSENLPFWIEARVQGAKIEKLKRDTNLQEKDISGTISGEAKINGFLNDPSKLNGAGKILITDGNLWQLNLFKGLGEILFAKDFANIVFNEGYCGFIIQDKYIFSDNLKLKSNFVNLTGDCKLTFDSSIDASLNVEVLDEFVPLSGTLKDVATAIIGQAGRFGIIKISGTIKEPKYKFQPAVVDIIKGLKDAILGK